MAVEPIAGAMPGIDLVASLPEPMTLARVYGELRWDSVPNQRLVELLCLSYRCAEIIRAMEDQRWSSRSCHMRHGRAIKVPLELRSIVRGSF